MKIYFGNANDDLFADGLYTLGEDQFYYGIEHGTNPGGMDEVSIFDGCGRSIPIHNDAIPELIGALREVLEVHEAIKKAEELTARAESNVKGRVQKAWHDDFEVDFGE